MDNRPIGVFDSGLGGLTAVREIMRAMPYEDIIYFGDTGRVPYGPRSRETIIKYTRQDINFLRTFDIKAIVVACGTASSAALDLISGQYDIPITGVVRSSAMRAVAATKNQKICVIGTMGTVKSGSYKKLILEKLPGANVIEKACPLFVPLVEEGRFKKGDPLAEQVAMEYLKPIKEHNIDTMILGCTHYPLLSDIISDIMGPDVTLVDSGAEAANYINSVLTMTEKHKGPENAGNLRCFVSDDPGSFARHAALFMGGQISVRAEYVDIDRF